MLTEPKAASKPPVTHQPFSLHKQQVQQCLPSLAQAPAVSEVLCHTLQEHPALFALRCTLLPADIPTLFHSPGRTLHLLSTGTWEGEAVTEEMHQLHWAGTKTLWRHRCWPVSGTALAAPLLMGFWLEMQLRFLPHVEIPGLHKQRPAGHIPKALQHGVEKEEDPSPIPNHTKTAIIGTFNLLNVEFIHRVTRESSNGVEVW